MMPLTESLESAAFAAGGKNGRRPRTKVIIIPAGKYLFSLILVSTIISAVYLHLGWECMQKSDELVYYKLDMAGVSITPNVSFSLHIGNSFSWRLYCGVEVSPAATADGASPNKSFFSVAYQIEQSTKLLIPLFQTDDSSTSFLTPLTC